MDVTIRSQAIASGLENELSTIKIIPQLMSRIERHHDVEGPVRKEIVMMALQIIKGRVPPEKQEEIEMLISLIDSIFQELEKALSGVSIIDVV